MPTLSDPTDPELMNAITRHGDREHVLRNLEAAGNMGEMTALDVAYECDVEDEDVDTIAETFVREWDFYIEEIGEAHDHDHWLETIEEKYGDQADEYLNESSSGILDTFQRVASRFR